MDKCTVIEEISDKYEALWIKISNKSNINIRVGSIYAPQENRTKRSVIQQMYDNIKKHIREAEKKKEKILITGDLNTKIGEYIEGNRKDISKYGKMLLEIIRKEEIGILNTHKNCYGLWTRVEGETKSIIDYAIVNKNDMKDLNKMIIDENKIMTPFRIIKGRTIYSDHCAIVIDINWYVASKKEQQQNRLVVNNKTLNKFKRLTNDHTLTNIVKQKGKLRNRYTKWSNCMNKIIDRCFNKKQKNKDKQTMIISKLYSSKRKLKRNYINLKKRSKVETKKYRIQKKLINEYIEEEERRGKVSAIKKNMEEIRKSAKKRMR